MMYSELANASIDAFRSGIERIITKTLPSVWDKDGIGWHEQWDNVEFAGIYASCEGIVLLSMFDDSSKTLDIIKKVYLLNLCRAFDKDYYIDETSAQGSAQKRQRDKAINVSYKLSKFLLATKYINSDDHDGRIVSDVLGRLISLFDFNNLQFKIAFSYDNTSILSTALSFIAIKDFIDKDNPIILSTKQLFENILASELSNSNIDSMILVLWALSESIDIMDTHILNRATRQLKKILEHGDISDNSIITVKFSIPMLGVRDSYSINKHLIFLNSVVKFIRIGFLEVGYAKFVIPDIQRIISIVQTNKAYGENIEPFTVKFWENYYALLLLDNFYKMVYETNLKEDTFMIVTPKYFLDKDLTVRDDLVVVLMPFKLDWSDEIYEVFKDAVGSHTGITFSVWRSDEEYTADIIIQTVWEKIKQARFIIADCTGKNPNVFYELGIAHTLGKPVFMCSQNRNDFPFDINHIRSYEYGLRPNDVKKIKMEILHFISNLYKEDR